MDWQVLHRCASALYELEVMAGRQLKIVTKVSSFFSCLSLQIDLSHYRSPYCEEVS